MIRPSPATGPDLEIQGWTFMVLYCRSINSEQFKSLRHYMELNQISCHDNLQDFLPFWLYNA